MSNVAGEVKMNMKDWRKVPASFSRFVEPWKDREREREGGREREGEREEGRVAAGMSVVSKGKSFFPNNLGEKQNNMRLALFSLLFFFILFFFYFRMRVIDLSRKSICFSFTRSFFLLLLQKTCQLLSFITKNKIAKKKWKMFEHTQNLFDGWKKKWELITKHWESEWIRINSDMYFNSSYLNSDLIWIYSLKSNFVRVFNFLNTLWI